MKKHLIMVLGLSVLSTTAFAQMRDSDNCDSDDPNNCDSGNHSQVKEPNKTVYPYKPFSTAEIQSRLSKIYESSNYLNNIYEMDRRGLSRANTTVQPWGGSFWPLYQGGIAANYQDIDSTIFITTPLRNLMWQANYSAYNKHASKVHPAFFDMDDKDLGKLSPAEKYDLILGDTSFDLTSRSWDITKKRGEQKNWGFLGSIDLPEGFRIPVAKKTLAFWEGICHGWALGAGYIPRPEKTVFINLPNGKQVPFYPNDIKALASQVWANSDLQDNAIFEGNRCNKKDPDQDQFGRYIDTEIDVLAGDTTLIPRCGDTHPAIFHVGVVNVMGVEGRPITLDHNPKMAIANQPMSGYEFTYFNPDSGKDGSLQESMMARSVYTKDPYAENRNPDAVYIVGVSMNAKYVDWEIAKKKENNSPSDDKIIDDKFLYDLEINAAGQIVGGQWRSNKKVKKTSDSTNQPDYFWLAPRNYKKYLQPDASLPKWSGSGLPPREFLPVAQKGHAYLRNMNSKLGGYPKCDVFSETKKGETMKVDCQINEPRPRPLVNVVDHLIELSRQ